MIKKKGDRGDKKEIQPSTHSLSFSPFLRREQGTDGGNERRIKGKEGEGKGIEIMRDTGREGGSDGREGTKGKTRKEKEEIRREWEEKETKHDQSKERGV